jgi:transketolase C-terminal domain/subunit
MRILGVRDVFGESGEYEQLLSKHRLDAKNLVLAAHELMRLKK